MPSILVLGIYFLLFLSDDDEEVKWIWFLHDDSDEDDGDNYDVNNFLGMNTWRIWFHTTTSRRDDVVTVE